MAKRKSTPIEGKLTVKASKELAKAVADELKIPDPETRDEDGYLQAAPERSTEATPIPPKQLRRERNCMMVSG